MMRLPSAMSVSSWQTSRAVRGEVVSKTFYARVIAYAATSLEDWSSMYGRQQGNMPW
jgi:hypothetical protein